MLLESVLSPNFAFWLNILFKAEIYACADATKVSVCAPWPL